MADPTMADALRAFPQLELGVARPERRLTAGDLGCIAHAVDMSATEALRLIAENRAFGPEGAQQ